MKIERYSITRGHTDVWWEVVPDLEGSMCFYSDVKRLEARNAELVEALKDMLSGWRYLRAVYGDLSGVGWDRAENAAGNAIAKAKGEGV